MQLFNLKRQLFTLLCIFFITLAFPTFTFAHSIEKDDVITTLIHIEPNDTPFVGVPATFHILITDKTNKFNFANCLCTIEILQNGKNILTLKLQNTPVGIYDTSFSTTFSNEGSYIVAITGRPQALSSFQSFHVSYSFDVTSQSTARTSDFIFMAIFFGIFIGGAISIGIFVYKSMPEEFVS